MQADARTHARLSEAKIQAVTRVQLAERPRNAVRDELHVSPGRDLPHALQVGKLLGEALDLARHVRPKREFVVPLDGPGNPETPALHVLLLEPQALERNSNPDHVSLGGELAFRI